MFIQLKSTTGYPVYVNPDLVVLISPAKNLVGVAVVTTTFGLNFEIEGTATEVQQLLSNRISY
jgi:hypothetical protein